MFLFITMYSTRNHYDYIILLLYTWLVNCINKYGKFCVTWTKETFWQLVRIFKIGIIRSQIFFITKSLSDVLIKGTETSGL